MKPRKIIGNILIILTVIFTVYLSIIMTQRINAVVLKDSYKEMFQYELIACGVLLLFALDVRFKLFKKLFPGVIRAAGWVLRIIVVLITAVLVFFFVKISAGSFIRTEAPAKNVLVLGLALENGKPTDDLVSRLDTAEEYLRKNPEATLILTGGNPDESGRSEADVMHDILLERGIPEERMITEDQAETTKENFRNAAQLEQVDPGEPIVLISSDYHMDRAAGTALDAGFTNVLRLPAPSSFIHFGANVMGEVILELNELTLRK